MKTIDFTPLTLFTCDIACLFFSRYLEMKATPKEKDELISEIHKYVEDLELQELIDAGYQMSDVFHDTLHQLALEEDSKQ